MKKVLLFGYYGEGNLGDELLLKSLLFSLSTDFEIGVLSKKKDKNSNYRFFNKFSPLQVYKALKWADVVVAGGGGLFQDKTSIKSFFYYLSIVFFALLFNKKLYLLGQSFSPLRNRIEEKLLGFILTQCNKVYVRDSLSYNYLKKINVPEEKIKLSTDLVFLLDFNYKNVEAKYIGINLRRWKDYSLNDIYSLLTNLAGLINKEMAFYALHTEDKYLFDELDNYIKSKIKFIELAEDNIEEFFPLNIIFIGMRLHSHILSVLFEIPFIAISYDEKVKGFCEDIGWKFVVDELSSDKIKDYFNEILKNYDQYKEYLKKVKNMQREKIREDIDNFKKEIC